MADPTNKRPRRLINGCFPKPPFWLTSLLLLGACGSILLVARLSNARTSTSELPRVHIIQDMDNEVKVKVQHETEVFADGRGELHGFEWRPSAEPHVTRLSGLGGPSAVAVAPLVQGNLVYVADLRDGQGMVRRLGIEW